MGLYGTQLSTEKILETLLTVIAAVVVGIPTLFILYFGFSTLWDRMKPRAPKDMAELLHLYARSRDSGGRMMGRGRRARAGYLTDG